MQKGWVKVEALQKIQLLEDRLRSLDRNNYGICRKIERKIRALRKQLH